MKFTKSELLFILYLLLQAVSLFVDVNETYKSKLADILNKVAAKTDEAMKNESI